MLFFQAMLLLGYAYAHFLTIHLSRGHAVAVHSTLLALSILTLPVIPSDFWKPSDSSLPLWRILGLLTVAVGMPYFLLASTSPLLQKWYAELKGSGVPYRFFALSNLGSMLALLSYPVLIEPVIPLHMQARLWSAAYVGFGAFCFVLARGSSGARLAVRNDDSEEGPRIPWRERLVWMVLPACASALLLSVTNHITQNVAAIPFLWILPLSLYLLSFILTFDSPKWYQRRVFSGLFAAAIGAMGYAIAGRGAIRDLRILIGLFATGLFICCMVCHGELARRKPSTRHLTSFYLMISIGGTLGGLFVAAIAPNVFPALIEFPIALVATAAIVLLLRLGARFTAQTESEIARFRAIWFGSAAALAGLSIFLAWQDYQFLGGSRVMVRNFYGALRVVDDDQFAVRQLLHGTINHGEEYLDPVRRNTPTTYYAPSSGIGMLLKEVSARGPFRLGVIGLGAGTLAAYGRAGDAIRFYEINPLVRDLALSQFRYLKDCRAKIDIVIGDARLSLERAPLQHFDVLVVDAFSGDSIPVHLLTREAFRIYWRHLRSDGVLAVHISNKYLNLGPPVELLARESGKTAHLIENDRLESIQMYAADWVLVGGANLSAYDWVDREETDFDSIPRLKPWTDDFSNLWQILQ